MLPVLEVALHLLIPDALALYEDPAAKNQQQTPPLAPPAIGCGLHRPAGLAAYCGLPSSLG